MKIFFSVLLGVLLSINVFAQSNELNSGSTYSFYGTGLPFQTSNTSEKGMGVFGISYRNLNSPSLTNPAHWGGTVFSQASINFGFKNLSVEDAGGSGANSLLEIDSFQAIFPIQKGKLGLSVSLYPKTRTNYNIVSNQQVLANDGSEIELSSNKVGTGGVTNFEFGLGYKIGEGFSVGYAAGYSFLREKDTESLFLFDNSITSSVISRNINGTSISHRFGAFLSKGKIFSDKDKISFGATINLPMTFESKLNSGTEKVIDGQDVEIELSDQTRGNVSLPLEFGTGVTYFFNPNLSVTAETRFEKWKDTEYDFSAREQNALKDRVQLGFGTSITPKDYQRANNFFSNFKYSLGVTYDSGHLMVNNSDIETLWFSAGLGILSPGTRSASSFDISLQYGIRGTKSNSLVKENIFGINLSINLTELMFLQRKLN